MSERVRTAYALDAIEKVVDRCCESAMDFLENSNHMTAIWKCNMRGAIVDASALYSIDHDVLEKEAWQMLRNELNSRLRPMYEVKYVKPYIKDGDTVGMEVKVYKFGMFRW